MKVLLLNQCFYPDVMATGQYLTQLAVSLAERGHEVTVVASNRGYDDPTIRFPSHERWKGVRIERVSSLALGKQSKLRRALNFASFLATCSFRLLTLKRFDVVVALTSPPLISFLGALFTRLKGGRFCFWVMDLNPDEAIAAGWLRERSVTANFLQRLLIYSLEHSEKIVVLDGFMKARILKKGIEERRIFVLPPWSQDDTVAFDPVGRAEFRSRLDISDKFVVMYSGNHSPCHPLDTLLSAAKILRDNSDFVFYFVGGGSEQRKVREFARDNNLANIKCLPYQPQDELAASLSAADLHVVVMGNPYVGIVHPCKIYNIMAVGARTLYIGPPESHVMDLAQRAPAEFFTASHGDPESVVAQLLEAYQTRRSPTPFQNAVLADFSRQALLPRLNGLLESSALSVAVAPNELVSPAR